MANHNLDNQSDKIIGESSVYFSLVHKYCHPTCSKPCPLLFSVSLCIASTLPESFGEFHYWIVLLRRFPSLAELESTPSSPPFRFGVRFPCMSDAYDRELRELAHDVATELGYNDFLREGVYCVLGGPSFETIAECRMLHMLGADAVGEFVNH